MIKVKEHIPRMVCTDDRLKQLRKAGFKTDGYKNSMERILQDKGFGLPGWCEERQAYAFSVNYKYIRAYLNYADTLAEEILLLHKLKLL